MNKRYFGLIGILGSILLFIGDMFLYGHFGSAFEFNENIRNVAQNASLARLFIGGITGPIGALLYMAGFWHIYLNTKQTVRSLSLIILLSLTCMMSLGGAYHSLWTIRMLLYKYPSAAVGNSNAFIASFDVYFKTFFNISLSMGCLGGVLLGGLILFKKCGYSRWMLLVNPCVLLMLTPLIRKAPYPFGSILYGGYINIVLFIFLTVSVVTTWKDKNIS